MLSSHQKEEHRRKIPPELVAQLLIAHPPHPGQHPTLPLFRDKRPMASLPLLSTQEGFTCTICPYSALANKTMTNHFYKSHNFGSAKTHIRKATLQINYTQRTRAWFPVDPEIPFNTNNPFSSFLKSISSIIPPSTAKLIQRDAKELTPFLRREGWLHHVQGFKPEDLVALVGPPLKSLEDHLEQCRIFIRQYMEDTEDRIKGHTNQFVLRLLNSESLQTSDNPCFLSDLD